MVFYQLHIFNRSGKCLYALECNKRKSRAHKPEQDQKLLFGMLHSLKNFLNQVNPCQLGELDSEPLHSYTTKGYRLHFFETLSGLRFVLTTDPSVDNLQDTLKSIFSLYVEYVVKNPLHTPGETVTCLSFVNEVGECLKRHAQYA